ncbi:MAG: (5-formylfuran-3-yl)methyl phosphate synthase [Aureliella sp.]
MSEPAFPSRRQLLVSVQNVREAELARNLGVPWIDLKNPAFGSLGRPDLLTARKVAAALAPAPVTDSLPPASVQPASVLPASPRGRLSGRLSSHAPQDGAAACQTSVALGELRTLNFTAAAGLMQLFPVAKIGLAGLGSAVRRSQAALMQQLDGLRSQSAASAQIVLAMYADFERAGGPEPLEVLEIAAQLGSPYVLVDTFIKDGQGLFHWLTLQQLSDFGQRAAQFGASLVVAGSLTTSDWPLLSQLGSVIVGVRGGVCMSDADRSSRLSPERLRQWLEWSRTEAQRN